MISRGPQPVHLLLFLFLFLLLSPFALAQVMSIPSSGFGEVNSSPVGLSMISSMQMTNNLYGMTANMQNQGLGAPSNSLSRLDLKAPWKARREYDKGYQLLIHKDYRGAIPYLSKATQLYPSFVAAHNALGSAYLNLGQNDQARDEFSQAVALDDHLPNLHLNLGVAELALRNYPAAEESLKKASSIAPLDLALVQALAYAEFVNKDYSAVIATASEVHGRQHQGAAIVHYFAAGAWEAQDNLPQAENELNTLLREEPKSAAADQARQILQRLKADEIMQAAVKQQPAPAVTFSFEAPTQPSSEEATKQAQKIIQNLKEKSQIAEAEAAEPQPNCATCAPPAAPVPAEPAAERSSAPSPAPSPAGAGSKRPGGVLRASVDEVAVFFAATDHGKSVTDLKGSDIGVLDNQAAPAVILGFRNEAELPLRLGLVIDTSDSVAGRFSFEQGAAVDFLREAVTGKDDRAFVVGVNNSVLMVQDFTGDQSRMARAVNELMPSGGTALWDAVAFAADKLARYPDPTPVARILVVISDGENNSGTTSLKQAIEHAQHGEVAVYTVSTRDFENDDPSALLGDHALHAMAELTGGAAFVPGSIRRLKGSLSGLQQVIRSRYLVSYKPALFKRNGQYRTIDITAQKDGHKLKVYARKGYYASAAQPGSATQSGSSGPTDTN